MTFKFLIKLSGVRSCVSVKCLWSVPITECLCSSTCWWRWRQVYPIAIHHTNHMWIHILQYIVHVDQRSFCLCTGWSCWLIFVPRPPSCLRTMSADFWSLNANIIRTGRSDGVWTGSVGCWRRLIAESMNFSGYFDFKNENDFFSSRMDLK